MAELVNIPQPRYGVLREAPKARRTLLSVFDAENMMMRETGTGIRRLSTRPTLKRFVDADLGTDLDSISALHPVTWATSREIFSQLETGTITTEWADASEDGQNILHCVEDGRGGLYSLSSGGRIERRNAEGEVAFAVAIPIAGGMLVAPRLLVDPLGGIYAAASAGVGGGQSRLFKFLPREDSDGADLVWVLDVTGSEVADIALHGGQIFMGLNEPGRVAKVVAIENTGEGEPFQSWEMPVPYPVSALKYGLGLTFSSLPDLERGDGSPIGGDDAVWYEDDLADADKRVHAVYDARRAGDFPDGARMTRLAEIRRSIGIASKDTTDRDMLQSQWFRAASNELTVQNSGSGSPGPRFRSQLSDGEPALWFNHEEGTTLSRAFQSYDKGSGLWSQQIDASLTWKEDKVDDESSLSGSRGLWPHTPGQNFVVAWKLRWPKGSAPGMVWSVGGWLGHWENPALDADTLVVIVQDDATSATVQYADGGVTVRGAITGAVQGSTSLAVEVDGMWEAIVLIERRAAATSSVLRINGNTVATNLDFFPDRFQSAREVWGNRIHNEEHRADGAPAPGTEWMTGADSFDGGIQKAVSIMAPSSGAPNFHDVSFSYLAGGEIEKIEGSMAWRRQSGVILPGSHSYDTAGGFPPRGSAPDLPQETATARAMRSPDGIIGLLLPGQDSYGWAVSGSGIGYDHTSDRLGNIYTTGPWLADKTITNEAGPRSQIFRRMIDRGLAVDYLKPSAGEVMVSGFPAIDDAFIIDPGDGPITYAFDGTGVPSATYYVVARGGDTEAATTTLVNVLTVGGGGFPGRFYAQHPVLLEGTTYTISMESRDAPSEVAAVISVIGATQTVISDMDGGAAPAGAWDIRDVKEQAQEDARIHIAANSEGDLFAPWVKFGSMNEVVRLAKDDGTVVWTHATGLDTDPVLSVAIDRREVNFGSQVDSTEFLWTGGDGTQVLEKWRLVERFPNLDPPQKTALLVVKGGQAFYVEEDGTVRSLGAPGDFKDWDPYMQVLDYQGDLLISDGETRKRWSPRNDTYEDWTAKRGSEIPTGSHIMSSWNSRVVHAGGENPYNWIMSAAGDPDDYELFPSQPSANQAVSGDSGDGQTTTQDQITGLIPAADDLLIILGSRTISRMTGDPMAGGYLDKITGGVGGAFGDAWTQAPSGSIYFFGVPNSVHRISPTGQDLENMSIGRIEEELRGVDLTKYRIQMVYSHKMEGICVVPTPLSLSEPYDGRWWFMDNSGAWWPQTWMKRAHQPLSMASSIGTGEPLFGCRDGVVRSLSGTDGLDGEDEMHSSVTFGPYFDRQYHKVMKYTKPFARIDGEASVDWEAYVGGTPLLDGAPSASGSFHPGEETPGAMKLRGSALWLRLKAFGSRWSFEGGTFDRTTAGRQK